MSHGRNSLRAVPALVLLFAVLLSLTACSAPPAAGPAPSIGDPTLSVPSPIKPGETVGISVPVNGPTNDALKYEWIAPAGKGEIIEGQGTSGITYKAPEERGTYKISLKVTGAGTSLERSVFVTVQGTGAVELPTDSLPTPVPGTPTPCRSLRPPFEDTGKFAVTGSIEEPKDGATGVGTASSVTIGGSYAGKTADATLWLLTYAPNNLYYPQSSNPKSGEAMPQTGGRWVVSAWMGAKGGDPECFDLVLIATDAELSQYLGEYLQKGQASGDFPGISPMLLQGHKITELAHATVQTDQ